MNQNQLSISHDLLRFSAEAVSGFGPRLITTNAVHTNCTVYDFRVQLSNFQKVILIS